MQKIATGSVPDDGTGDSVRDAFDKVNSNFQSVIETQWSHTAARQTPLPTLPTDFVPRHLSDHAPDSPPPVYGAMWIIAPEGRIFIATGTQSADDWRELQLIAKD